MTVSEHHIIGLLRLEVNLCGNESEGLSLQRRLSDQLQARLMQALVQAFDRCATGEHLCINLLQVDAGTLAIDRLESDLAGVVEQAVEKAIHLQHPSGYSSPFLISANTQRKTERQSVQEAFFYFLKTGRLPWSFRLQENTTLEQMFLNNWLSPAPGSGKIPPEAPENGVLLQLLTRSAAARQRICWQFSETFLNVLLAWLSPQMQQTIQSILRKLRRSAVPSPERKLMEKELWQTAFAKVPPDENSTIRVLTETLQVISRSMSAPGYAALLQQVKTLWPELASKELPNAYQFDAGTVTGIPVEAGKSFQEGTNVQADATLEPGEGIYIDNAGLVLLHPFLPMIFEALDISREDSLLQPNRALCLLHFLATGQTTAPEYELTLPKILCNIPPELPVKPDVSLTEEEQNEAIALLEAVVRHWEVLRSTSPDGLRATFLLRPGKLSVRPDGDWQLQVENRSFDILLDHLPWGISMIKLPWMERMLWVEWR